VEEIPKIFQVFNLDQEKMRKISRRAKGWLSAEPPKLGQMLIKELKAKGYDVFVNPEKIEGLPMSILVVGEFRGRSLKAGFYEIANRLGLKWFESGEVYIETP